LVVLDLRELAFIDAAGVRTIVNAGIRARQAGRRLVLLRGLPNVDRVFTLAGSSGDIEIGISSGHPVGVFGHGQPSASLTTRRQARRRFGRAPHK
jgi:hypothetical protein